MRRTYRRREVKPVGVQFRVNTQIVAPELRLIDENAELVGIVSLAEALNRSRLAELDLVEVSPMATPPVAKILDYHQFKYQKDKEVQKSKAKQKKQEIKGIRLSLRIGDHDKGVRLNQATKFLDDGHKLKIELQLRGRENRHKDMAEAVITGFVEDLRKQYDITVEQPVQKMGNKMSLVCFSSQKKGEKKTETTTINEQE